MALNTPMEIGLSAAESNYYAAMVQYPGEEWMPGETVALVGAGLGGGFANTQQLHVMNYDAAMPLGGIEADEWQEAVDEEHQRMKDHTVFQSIPREQLPANEKVMTSTWAMKRKSTGVKRGRLNLQGFEQVDGVYYSENKKSAPVVTNPTIMIMLILSIMARMWQEVLDVQGAFLYGTFEDGIRVYMEVPQGFEKFYPGNVVLLLLKTLYGAWQGARAFWIKLLEALHGMKCERSKADPCLYFKWTLRGLLLWVSWIDDYIICGDKRDVTKAKEDMKGYFDCDEVGELKDYVGCVIDYNKEEHWMKLTQPVLMQSFKDEFDLPDTKHRTPAIPGSVLRKPEDHEIVSPTDKSKYRAGVRKLLHMMKWTRPDILNSVRELSRFVSGPSKATMGAMYRVMSYCVQTPN